MVGRSDGRGEDMTRWMGALLLSFALLCLSHGQAYAGAAPPGGSIGAAWNNAGATAGASESLWPPTPSGEGPPRVGVSNAAYIEKFEYRSTLACGNIVNADANLDPTACTLALSFCATSSDPNSVYYYAWYREKGTGPWLFSSAYCSGSVPPPGMPPPQAIPSMVQIREAFASLPFGRPTVAVEPVGGKTLVNLPTFFEIQWDGSGLEPGSVSAPVQLLSWSVEFEVATQSYTVDFGDGLTSGATTDRGGPYPSGNIRHTYVQPLPAAAVKADTVLTGRFRVNGGAWQDLGGVADLQNEPVTTLEVLEARARLVT